MPISTITDAVPSSIGKMWLGRATMPIVAAIADSASRIGTPAATMAPNATNRIRSVTGSDRVSALWRSSMNASSSSFIELASPNCVISNCGLAAWAAFTGAVTAS